MVKKPSKRPAKVATARKRSAGRSAIVTPGTFAADLSKALDWDLEDPRSLNADRKVCFDSLRECAISYLFTELLSKFDEGGPSNEKRRVETQRRFNEAEERCKSTNRRLASQGFAPYFFLVSRGMELCEMILGKFSWDDCHPYMGWGPGASTRLTRRNADSAYKFSGIPETTIGNAALAWSAIASCPPWKQSVGTYSVEASNDLTIVDGNRIVTVPKNSKVDRTIAIEPDMNMYVQKGIGGVIRKRLRYYGCDLNDQRRNQRLARIGSFSGHLATIDLSMASDTISYEFVRRFVPYHWFEALEQCRSPLGVLPSGEQIAYQKFSSMGNGYTFELESLIFYSLALAVVEHVGAEVHRVAVYGDDIVVPSSAAALLSSVLDTCGFATNVKKTFVEGPFRESCGKHFYRGHDVTPFYIRKPIKSLDRLFLLHNQTWRWAHRVREAIGEVSFKKVLLLCNSLRQRAPSKWRLPRIPDGFGDGAFIGYVDELNQTPHPYGWEGWQAKALVRQQREVDCQVEGLLTKSLMGLEHPRRIQWEDIEFGIVDVNYESIAQNVFLRSLGCDGKSVVQPSEVGAYREGDLFVRPYPPSES